MVLINDDIHWGKFGPWVWEGGWTYFEESDGYSPFWSGIVDDRFMMGVESNEVIIGGVRLYAVFMEVLHIGVEIS